MKCFTKLMKKFDKFGVNLTWTLNNRYQYGSFVGGVCYLSFICISVIFVALTFRTLFSGTQYNIVVMEKSYNPSKTLNVTEHQFTFALRISFDNETSVFDSSLKNLFILTINYVKREGNKKTKIPIEAKPCTEKDFNSLKSSPVFKYMHMNTFRCFDSKEDLILAGTYNEKIMKYLEVQVSLNPMYVTNFKQVEDIFSHNQFKFSMYYTDPLYDVTNRDNPVFNELKSFYTYLDLPVFKRNNIDFQEFVFSDDQNIMVENYKDSVFMKLKSHEEISVSMKDRIGSTLNDRFNIAKYYLRAFNMQSKVKRQYMKFPEFLANTMALLFNLVIVMGLFVYSLNYMLAKQSLMKRINKYDDDLADNHKQTLLNIHSKISNNPDSANKVKDETANNYDLESQTLVDNKKEVPKKPYNHYLIRGCDMFQNIVCCGMRKDKSEIFNKGEERIVHNLDLTTYLNKMNEIDVLKYMLLDKDSLRLMKFVSKPGISSIKDEVDEKRDPFFKEDLVNEFPEPDFEVDLKEIHQSYLRLKAKETLTDPEKKVIELFESQVKNIVELDVKKEKK